MRRVSRNRVLICADWFAPGVRAGGPIRSCVNLTELIGSSGRLSIITSNLDLGVREPYSGIQADCWINWHGKATVQYCSSSLRRGFAFVRAIRRLKPNTIYFNSMFSVAGTLWPLLYGFATRSRIRIVLAPRGMLKATALSQKALKKRLTITCLRRLGIMNRVTFHATSRDEVEEIRNAFGDVSIKHIANVPCIPLQKLPSHRKQQGSVRLTFVGRVHPIKNLLWLIKAMQQLNCKCHLTIVGPIEDLAYYTLCCNAIAELKDHIVVEFAGVLDEELVKQILCKSDAMILPTLGENFGHAIFEALAVGTPVIISDRTIWRGLSEKKAGWDCPLDDATVFCSAIGDLATMGSLEHDVWRSGALKMANDFVSSNQFMADYTNLLCVKDK